MRPIDVTYENAESLRKSLKEKAVEQHGPTRWKENRFNLGDPVRVEKYKQVFKKGYLPNFTNEIFIVAKVRLVPHQPPTYRIRDREGALIRGWFYANDLVLVRKRLKESKYIVEKVLDKRRHNREEQIFVKFKG
ncbi:unnamed protein product [Meloidogyne enterolobii]|uniref:Uncharacterized protein n=1 Tax=Meloidogyne enterolobii TaxID=390850 RepID=A0ACB1ANX6_MELEN